jgi:hypothetical protein
MAELTWRRHKEDHCFASRWPKERITVQVYKQNGIAFALSQTEFMRLRRVKKMMEEDSDHAQIPP